MASDAPNSSPRWHARLFSRSSDVIAKASDLLRSTAELDRASGVESLIQVGRTRRGWDAWATLARGLGSLSPELQERAIVAGAQFWPEVCQELGTSSSEADRRAAARVAGLCDAPEVIFELVSLLRDSSADVSEESVRSLCSQVRRVIHGAGVGVPVRQAVERCVVEALGAYEQHRRKEVVWAALAMTDTPARIRGVSPGLRAWAEGPEQVSHMPARGMIRRGGTDDLPQTTRQQAWMMLGRGPLDGACVDCLLNPGTSLEHAGMLESAHLVQNPRRERAWCDGVRGREKVAMNLWCDEGFIQPDGERAARRVALVMRAAGDIGAASAALGLLVDPRPLVRWSLVREVTAPPLAARSEGQGTPSLDVLLDAAHDADDRVAASAVLAAQMPGTREGLGRRALLRSIVGLRRSTSARVRTLAQQSMASHDPWNDRSAESRTLARRMLRRDLAGFVLQLREGLATGTGEQRLSAVRLSQRLNLLSEVEFDLIQIVSAGHATHGELHMRESAQEDLRVVAGCVTALGRCDSPAAARALVHATRHDDARVRANAVDAIAGKRQRGMSLDAALGIDHRLVELKSDPHHRVRASAVEAVWLDWLITATERPGPVPDDGVLPMLRDERPMHRIAGLWLAERLGRHSTHGSTAELAGRVAGVVAGMVTNDQEASVRQRARKCATALLTRSAGGRGWNSDERLV